MNVVKGRLGSLCVDRGIGYDPSKNFPGPCGRGVSFPTRLKTYVGLTGGSDSGRLNFVAQPVLNPSRFCEKTRQTRMKYNYEHDHAKNTVVLVGESDRKFVLFSRVC